jgi:beta-phosphoglucomutase-like phosphatase (HAD superfamily)
MRPIKAILFEPNCLADAEGPFEDVPPAFAELKSMGIQLHIAAEPEQTLYVTDNAAGLTHAKAAGMIPILLMHDPDEAMRLVANNPAGGVVSLLELPDLVRYVAANPTPLPSPLLSVP